MKLEISVGELRARLEKRFRSQYRLSVTRYDGLYTAAYKKCLSDERLAACVHREPCVPVQGKGMNAVARDRCCQAADHQLFVSTLRRSAASLRT